MGAENGIIYMHPMHVPTSCFLLKQPHLMLYFTVPYLTVHVCTALLLTEGKVENGPKNYIGNSQPHQRVHLGDCFVYNSAMNRARDLHPSAK